MGNKQTRDTKNAMFLFLGYSRHRGGKKVHHISRKL